MKKVLLFIAACLLVGRAAAQEPEKESGKKLQEENLKPLTPTFLDNVFSSDVWGSNWFVSVKGGVSAFVGKPVGHGDIFDRTKMMLNVSAGKWFTPHIGGRLAFQGLKLVDSDIQPRSYQNVHADFLYNVAAHFSKNYEELRRWDVIPYAGCGIIRNSYTTRKPFAISYGIIGRYRLTDRLHVAAEVGATTTFQNFDGYGAANKFGDNLLQASIGLDITIGKVGWKRVIDPKPYVYQNDILMEYLARLKEENEKLDKMHQRDNLEITEMRKILEIEGLLDKYNIPSTDNNEEIRDYPKNNYSGLNSLRARLRNKNGENDDADAKLIKNEMTDSLSEGAKNHFKVMKDGKIFVGAPIFFFFQIGTDNLTEVAQIINIKEVANCMKKYGLHARIVGAADSRTGSAYTNERLSSKRAEYIARLMKKEGVPAERIQTQYRGGINTYEPVKGNRNTCVMLYFK